MEQLSKIIKSLKLSDFGLDWWERAAKFGFPSLFKKSKK